jgi:hypothetical protein
MQIQTLKVVGAKSRNFCSPQWSDSLHVHFRNVWRTFVRLGLITINACKPTVGNSPPFGTNLPMTWTTLSLFWFVSISQTCYKRSWLTKDRGIPEKPTPCIVVCNHLANLLQKFMASKKTNTLHRSMLLSFSIISQTCYKRSWHPRKPTHCIVACYYLF